MHQYVYQQTIWLVRPPGEYANEVVLRNTNIWFSGSNLNETLMSRTFREVSQTSWSLGEFRRFFTSSGVQFTLDRTLWRDVQPPSEMECKSLIRSRERLSPGNKIDMTRLGNQINQIIFQGLPGLCLKLWTLIHSWNFIGLHWISTLWVWLFQPHNVVASILH